MNRVLKRILPIFLYLFFCTKLITQNTVEELGKVHWIRDFGQAQALAAAEKKNIFILFQEIPGCSTCKNFGRNIMEHPFIVDAIEQNFIPLAIYNNKAGNDKKVLEMYSEPSWNNPVIRVVNANGENVTARGSGLYTLQTVVPYLRNAILSSGKLVPEYLQLLEDEIFANPKEITIEMYCFWTGEKELGKLTGVINTEAGYSNGKEVVKVTFDANKTSSKSVVDLARQANVVDAVHLEKNESMGTNSIPTKSIRNYHPDSDLHYYLKKSDYAGIPMTKMQATKINSMLGRGETPNELLSPSQLLILKSPNGKNLSYSQDIYDLWYGF